MVKETALIMCNLRTSTLPGCSSTCMGIVQEKKGVCGCCRMLVRCVDTQLRGLCTWCPRAPTPLQVYGHVRHLCLLCCCHGSMACLHIIRVSEPLASAVVHDESIAICWPSCLPSGPGITVAQALVSAPRRCCLLVVFSSHECTGRMCIRVVIDAFGMPLQALHLFRCWQALWPPDSRLV